MINQTIVSPKLILINKIKAIAKQEGFIKLSKWFNFSEKSQYPKTSIPSIDLIKDCVSQKQKNRLNETFTRSFEDLQFSDDMEFVMSLKVDLPSNTTIAYSLDRISIC